MTPDDIAQAVRLYTEHRLSLRQIAQRMGCAIETARKMLKSAGVELRPIGDRSSAQWTHERIDLITALWKDGRSAGQIVTALGGVFSRSAVLGKLGRLELLTTRPPASVPRRYGKPSQSRPERSSAPKAREAKPAPKPAKPVLALAGNGAVFEQAEARPPRTPESFNPSAWAPLAGSTPITLLQLTSTTCRWPVELGTDQQMFCGCFALNRYCTAHEKAELKRATKQHGKPAKPTEKAASRYADRLAKRWAA